MNDNQDNGHRDSVLKELTEMKDLKINDVKALFPEVQAGPLFSASVDTGNPGVRLIANDGNLLDMLKIVYVENIEMADNVADALGECDEFLMDENGKENQEVRQRIEWIKYKLAIYCSIKGRFADAYKQAATGVLTNAMSDGKGWTLLQLPLGGRDPQSQNNMKKDRSRP